MALYPPLEPFHQEYLPVGDGHELYLEQCGNPDGVPVMVLHGGPGGGSSPLLRRLFDPRLYRIVIHDQRGAGKSRPHAGTSQNTLAHLVDDIERIRQHLGVSRWRVVMGGSWGSTLALSYALEHGERVASLVLRGVFLCRRQDMDWLYTEHGAARYRPEQWQRLVGALPPGEGTVLARYHAALAACEDQNEEGMRLAREWTRWETHLSALIPPTGVDVDDHAWPMARLETHYFMHEGFLPEPLLPRCARLCCPVEIVHGSYDLVCPPEQAWLLHQTLPDSRLRWVPGAGHATSEAGIGEALIAAVHRLEQHGGLA
ncbi:prolyl aminopeptidase [Alloalcanivorax xenomutans]|uniref:prolyl aminopeptidase n=1 Tax=Alloalcanivorax xenomutans TaxID=1094342 RepID=UPI0009B61554|nr:prolyl aminopeptidase [Alloalcanivorax xenomutans]ARB44495.1 proline iminopeptidase [Alloalcanivorax xenomutans]